MQNNRVKKRFRIEHDASILFTPLSVGGLVCANIKVQINNALLALYLNMAQTLVNGE